MKSLIIYCSEYKKNTARIAQIFAGKIGSELINLRDINEIDIDNYDLIGFGSGVYKETMSPKLFQLVDKLSLKGKNVFVFSTSGVGMRFYNKKLITLLESKGAIVKGSFACKGSFTSKDFSNKKIFALMDRLSQGHPNDKDFREAEQFMDKIMNSLTI